MICDKRDWTSLRPELEILFEASFGKKISSKFLDWRYLEGCEDSFLFSVDRDDADAGINSSYSVFPVKMLVSGIQVMSGMSMTTMTHPRARGRGLFPLLALELYKKMADTGFSMVWGFPNSNSQGIFVSKLGWQTIYEIPTMILRLSPKNCSAIFENTEVQRDDSFELEYRPINHGRVVQIFKDSRFLKWRYLRNPANNYQCFCIQEAGLVRSYVVTKLFGSSVDIVDIQCANAADLTTIIQVVTGSFSREGFIDFQCWSPVHHFSHSVLGKLGFVNGEPITYLGGKTLVDQNDLNCDWTVFRNWYIQMGDSDIY